MSEDLKKSFKDAAMKAVVKEQYGVAIAILNALIALGDIDE